MKLCVAQTRPVRGNIQANIDRHKQFIDRAVTGGADIIIFPELSITGYEPELAKELATSADDRRFDDFQQLADTRQITIGIGVPTENQNGICISMVLFHPHQVRQTYSKKYLHADEEPFFVGGQNASAFLATKPNTALAICYEISVPDHAEHAHKNGAEIYLASVAKTAGGVEKAFTRLSEIASQYSMTVLMANCTGPSGDGDCAGKTAIWNNHGVCLGQLRDQDEGLLILDTDTQEITEIAI
jgi:predicted amidohydrolase